MPFFNKKPETPRPAPSVPDDPRDPGYCQKCGGELGRRTVFQFDKYTGEQVHKEIYLDCYEESDLITTYFQHDHWVKELHMDYPSFIPWWALRPFGDKYGEEVES